MKLLIKFYICFVLFWVVAFFFIIYLGTAELDMTLWPVEIRGIYSIIIGFISIITFITVTYDIEDSIKFTTKHFGKKEQKQND